MTAPKANAPAALLVAGASGRTSRAAAAGIAAARLAPRFAPNPNLELVWASDTPQVLAALRSSLRFAAFLVPGETASPALDALLGRIRRFHPLVRTPVFILAERAPAPELRRLAIRHRADVLPSSWRVAPSARWSRLRVRVATSVSQVRQTHSWLRRRAAVDSLDGRELLVLEALLDGAHERDVADTLGLVELTFRSLLGAALRKVQVRTLPELLRERHRGG